MARTFPRIRPVSRKQGGCGLPQNMALPNDNTFNIEVGQAIS